MAEKYIKQEAGRLKEVASSQASAGAVDAGKIISLNAEGKVDETMMPTGIGADTATVPSSESLSAGDFINIYDDAGTPTIRKADATTVGKEACGFVLDSVTSGGNGVVYFEGTNNQLSGLTAGIQYLATTAGATIGTAPSGSGNVVQRLGYAVSATEINVELSQPIELA